MKRNKNGQGSFRKLDNGKYLMRMQSGYLSNGTPRILSVTGKSQSECIKKMKEKERNLPEEIDNEVIKRYTLSDLCEAHLEADASLKGLIKSRSITRRHTTIDNQIRPYPIGRFQVNSIKDIEIKKHIENLINEERLSISTIEKSFLEIDSSYKWAICNHYINYNPCDSIRKELNRTFEHLSAKNSSDGVVIVLSTEQTDIILLKSVEKTNNRYKYQARYHIEFLLETGMRIGEYCAARWNSWDRKTHTFEINKTRGYEEHEKKYDVEEGSVKNNHNRTIVLSPRAEELLELIYSETNKRNQDDYILLNRVGKPTNPSNFGYCLNSVYRAANMPTEISGAHVLRRTCATRMYDTGCTIEDIAAYLGDTPETILKHYISLTSKIVEGDKVKNVVQLPRNKRNLN